ncbi:MAG: multicopper oxidase domain-containing protein [Bacteroidetes bacterium]|nr:multicopper oxidase domain-containing protein [Bacteroidota bacterium]MBU1484533.1 multicopper oxidase domain-containing protein [Bacteroidota bacterium]MBU2268370.1 multicopper oxidase domain-containing protein [Bacteroidota bacterium]MBU2374686.1 multicopper oxidase domain-containing protein [Bacteroidota bacterium]
MRTLLLALFLCAGLIGQAQTDEMSVEGNVENLPVHEYTLTIDQKIVNKAGKDVMGMTINGQIPGPTLEFIEGEYAIIHVKNNMDVETSIHWHGLLLPNFYDGVPYITTPPIEPGETFTYEFAIKQNGTYWYHSHTGLQEQSGVYGSIVIQPKEKTLDYDKELVVMLSDWTNEKPKTILRYLKRGSEWFNIRKGTSTPLNQVIARGALGAQLKFWKQRMNSADIADIYYPAFLINGEQTSEHPEFKPGEKVRLRVIDGGASTSFWITFGGEDPILIAADGKDVVPVKHNKTFIGIAETYDYIVTIPQDGKIEFKSTAQDGSGTASTFLGSGKIYPAPEVPKPDKIALMQKIAKMKMRMGAPALKYRPNIDDPYKMAANWGMKVGKAMKEMGNMPMDSKVNKPNDGMDNMNMKDGKMDMNKESKISPMKGMNAFSEYNYDFLKSPNKTAYNKNIPVKEILLNLTGNMQRYIWSMNGIPLSEADKIKIEGDHVTRITFNNLTMMHHPMHLHGHFFRVINENGEYSPLKHTVNVPPMSKITIEFYGNEYGDWFFHCHILYHLEAGMARVVSYGTPRDSRMKEFPESTVIAETDKFYTWGIVDAASNLGRLNLFSSNIRNQFNFISEVGWNKNMEAEFTYQRYLYDYLSVFGGVNIENETPNSYEKFTTTAVAGIRFLTPYLFALDARIDNQLRPRIGVGRSVMLFKKFLAFGYYEYQFDFGWVNRLPSGNNFNGNSKWNAGAKYMLSRDFSLMASYDSRFGGGAGLSVLF